MRKIPFLGHRCWSILQVLSVVACSRRNASGERVQGCVGSRLSLICPEKKVIEVTLVVLGDSGCRWTSCCIKDNDCTRDASANHVIDVHIRCDGQSNCTVDVFKEEIDCGFFFNMWSNNDFERITYNCVDDLRSTLLKGVTERIWNARENSTEIERTKDSMVTSGDNNGIESADNNDEEQKTKTAGNSVTSEIIVFCCLIVLIVIVASVSFIGVRRKKKRQAKPPDANETDRMEAIVMNEAQGTSLNESAGSTFPICSNIYVEMPTSAYCKTEGVARGREYIQLYEPLTVYEQ